MKIYKVVKVSNTFKSYTRGCGGIKPVDIHAGMSYAEGDEWREVAAYETLEAARAAAAKTDADGLYIYKRFSHGYEIHVEEVFVCECERTIDEDGEAEDEYLGNDDCIRSIGDITPEFTGWDGETYVWDPAHEAYEKQEDEE